MNKKRSNQAGAAPKMSAIIDAARHLPDYNASCLLAYLLGYIGPRLDPEDRKRIYKEVLYQKARSA